MTLQESASIFFGAMVFSLGLGYSAKLPDHRRKRYGKIAGVALGICCAATVGFLIAAS